MYLPFNNVSSKNYIVKYSFGKICFFTVSLPLLAFVSCVLLTMYKDFDSANSTHCNVPNVFPSISSCIGNYEPQKTIWQSAIYIHVPVRFFIIYIRWKHYRKIIKQELSFVVDGIGVLNATENLSLIGLTYWTSTFHYSYHEACFKIFIGTSIFYMLFLSTLLTKYRRRPNLTKSENTSVKIKWRAFFINVCSFMFAAYFFLRHNKLCEPYVYSMFGFSEYIVVISNIAFHLTTVYDLPRKNVYITKYGLTVE